MSAIDVKILTLNLHCTCNKDGHFFFRKVVVIIVIVIVVIIIIIIIIVIWLSS